MKTTILLAIVALCAGCGSLVPANTVKIKTPRGSYKLAMPKQFEATNVLAKVETNGTFVISADYLSSKNDANVIDKASAGRVAELNAFGELVDKVGGSLGTLSGKGARAAVAP
jgi:hypothetical protein